MKFKLLVILIFISYSGIAQEISRFQVYTGNFDRLDCPIAMDLATQDIEFNYQKVQLIQITKTSRDEIPYQIDKENNLLWLILKGDNPKHTLLEFVFLKKENPVKVSQIEMRKIDGAMQFSFNDNPILNYQFEMTYPPKGVDEKYKKSGFIHPLWSPQGEVLTRIQPPDHYHHYGIWGPWTKTHIDNREVDFWNLSKGLGTVLFKKFTTKNQGNIFSSFTALQEHLDFGSTSINKVAIQEALTVKVWNIQSANKSWLIDYTSTIESPLKNGILFDAYRYGGGIGFRATEKWHKDNTTVITSENKDRLKADGTSAKWVIVEGASDTKKGRSGILFMGFPDNKEFPEPMRVWPVDANGGRGDVFFEFCPIRHVEWKIENSKKYQLKYRMLVFDGELTPEQAEIHWQNFANPPKIIIESK